jgi:hypothetical protein
MNAVSLCMYRYLPPSLTAPPGVCSATTAERSLSSTHAAKWNGNSPAVADGHDIALLPDGNVSVGSRPGDGGRR